MGKYYVIINGDKIFCQTKREADKIMIDAFLSGKNEINFKIYDTKTGMVCG